MKASLPHLNRALPTSSYLVATANWYGWALALASTVASSIVTPLVRGAVVGGIDPIALLLARLLIATILLLGTMALFDRVRFRIDRRGLWKLVVIGLISGVEICCFFWSLAFVDSSMSAIIKSTQPLIVLLLLALGGERITGRHLTRLGLAAVGIYLLVGAGGSVAPFGLVLLLLSLLLYALQLVLVQWWLPGYDTRTVTLYLTTIMTGVIALWWWAQGAVWQDPGPTGWLVIGVLAVVSTYLARLALFAAIRRIGSGQIALLWPLQTLLIVLLSVLFLNERLTLVQWGGGLLILSSAFLAVERMDTTPWRRRLRALMVTNRT
jgi:drug/metabolite transporter (DMT)-like permease